MTHFYNRFKLSRFKFEIPRRSDVIIYDQTGSKQLRCLFPASTRIEILNTRNETLNIFVAICSIFTLSFWQRVAFDAYIISYIRLSRPKIVITMIHDDFRFYRIHNRIKQLKIRPSFISIQNGTITKKLFAKNLSKILFRTNKPSCDYILAFNNESARFFSEHIRAVIHVCGSLRNNIHTDSVNVKSFKDKPQNVLFISTWRGGRCKTFNDPDVKLITIVSEWCKRNRLVLNILSSRPECPESKDFYEQFIDYNTNILRNDTPGSSFPYQCVDAAGLVVTVDSALGLEAIGRGKPVLSFPIRYPGEKPFLSDDCSTYDRHWSSNASVENVNSLLDKILRDCSNWKYYYHQYESLLPLDPGAKNTKKLISNIMFKN